MRSKGFVFLLLFLARMAAGQGSPRVYYVNGEALEQITDHDVTVTVSLKEEDKKNWLTVYVVNDSNDAVNVIPTGITLHQTLPKDEDLRLKTEHELQRAVGHGVFWGQVIAGVGAGLSRNISTVTTRTPYGSVQTVVNTPDYEAQARWLAWADSRAARGEAVKGVIGHDYLRATTLFPGSRFAGKLCFTRDKALSSGTARITLGSRTYQFPLPPPASAPTPPSAPELPTVGALTSAPPPDGATASPEATPSPTATARAGVLGVSGANWTEGGVSGVEILDVAPDSAAETAGLRTGYVITEINGRHVRSTEDLAGVLAQNGPGSRIAVAYIVKTGLGWMPSETSVVLTNR